MPLVTRAMVDGPAGGTIEIADITTNDRAKVRPFRHYAEPFAAEVAAKKHKSFQQWDSYANLQNFVADHFDGYIAKLQRPLVVGVLHHTDIVVYAELSDPHALNGITLVAGPFLTNHKDIASKRQLTDRWGSVGFMPSVEILDWRVVQFTGQFRGNSDEVEAFAKVYNRLKGLVPGRDEGAMKTRMRAEHQYADEGDDDENPPLWRFTTGHS